MNNKKDFKGAMTDLFSPTTKKDLVSPVVTEEKPKEVKKTTQAEIIKDSIGTKKRTYNIPNDILEDMEKVVYMDRDIKDNTDLLVRALRKYLSSNTCKDLISEYNTLKGGKN